MYIKRTFSRHRIGHKMNSCVLLSSLVFALSLGTFLSSTWGVYAQTIITQKGLNARRLAQERDGSHYPYETLKVCWTHASPLGLYPLRNETRVTRSALGHFPLCTLWCLRKLLAKRPHCAYGEIAYCVGSCTASNCVLLHSPGRLCSVRACDGKTQWMAAN